MKFIKNKFVFILLISAVTLGALILGAMTLYKEDDFSFSSDGYIISATAKSNTKYYFSANTKYKENVDEQIVFNDVDDKKVTVDPASFVHYSNGDVTFLKKGALVNLSELNSSMVNYYNITNESTINYENGSYVVSSNDKNINIESFIGRISDDKYLISGSNLTLKVPQKEELINGDYFEILFIEDGIVKIDNEKASYQVTAQDSYIYVSDNIVINLGSGKILYDNEAKMLMSQITINGDENIDLDVDEKNNSAGGGGGGGGSGSGTGNGDGDGSATGDGTGAGGIGGSGDGIGFGDGDGEGTGLGDGTGIGLGGASGDGTGEGEGTGLGDGTGTGGGGGSGNGTGEGEGEGTGSGSGGTGGSGSGTDTTASVQLELIEAKVTATTIDLSMQLNNATLAKGKLLYYFTNISTGKREGNSKYIDLVNGTFNISQESLSPSTDYSFTIVETADDGNIQYFQKTFRTKDLGITLEKVYATDGSLAYNLDFEENSEVTKARVSIYDANGENDSIENNQVIVSKSDIGKEILFSGLKSDTTYAVSVDMVWIDNAAYSDVYSINRMDTTLKKTPVISGVNVTANAEEVKFNIKLDKVKDPDDSIESYIYNIYLADDITADNLEPVVQYSVTKNDSDDLVLNLNEINELKTGVDYRCKIYAQYNDNEMIREVSTEYSGNFLIRSKPNVSFELKSATMNKVEGILSLIDANCTVPMNGRTCDSRSNKFTLRYYKLTEDEHNLNDREISFKADTLSTELKLENLESNTTYAVKVFGNYYDDDGILHEGVQIGDTFFVATDKSDNIYFEVSGDNISGQDKDGKEDSGNIVTFDAKLTAPQDSNIMEEIATITLNLYSGRYNTKDKLIGTYKITDKTKIQDFFSKMTITNKLFTDVTSNKVGLINTLPKLIKVTNNLTGTLNSSYTVEVEDVYDSSGKNKITVENPLYTFNLTPSYYLDSRIETNPNDTYVTVNTITKGGLWGTNKDEPSEEYVKLRETVKNLDSLADDTVVGIVVENSLSDIFVDSAFTEYEKVMVNYTIYNSTTKRNIKTVSVDMGNKYQPKEQIIYLDYSELDDGKNYFTRGYKYKVGFNLAFTTEDGSNPTYTNDALYKTFAIEKQKPTYTKYIYDSNDEGVTYRYSFLDVDNVITDKNFYYTLGKKDAENKVYKKISNALVKDGEEHEVTVPINENSEYSLYYAMINTDGQVSYISISDYMFEKEYKYDDSVSYSIVDDDSNTLKLKLENNVYTSRAYVYKVTIKSNGVDTYTKYFLADKLGVIKEATGEVDKDGKEIYNEYKYIGIDFANIIDFMNKDMEIDVFCYYDSGLVGINQKFEYGMVLKNYSTGKYLNTFYRGSDASNNNPVSGEGDTVGGFYHIRTGFNVGDANLLVYNHMIYANNKSFDGTAVGIESLSGVSLDDYGVNYGLKYTSDGLIFSDGNKTYKGYDFRVLNGVNLVTGDNIYKFDTIIPSVDITTNNTINSIKLDINTSGIYGNKQFIKDDKVHNKIYVTFYKDAELVDANKLTTVVTDVNITSTGTGYEASVDEVVYDNLDPATTYYYTVSAYINNKETRLFDSNTKGYTAVDYKTSTLDAKGIFQGIRFLVKPTAYDGEYPVNTLTWKLSLKNTENYGIRMELYRPDGTTTSTDSETGEEIVTTDYKAVNFDGTDAGGCSKDKYGTESNSYVNGCYISVSEDNISSINKNNYKYNFTNNYSNGNTSGFVYGGNYYKLVVYAIPYTNGKYVEDQRIVLYQNDSLTTASNGLIDKSDYYDISIPELSAPSFSLGNTLVAGSIDNADGTPSDYYISFTPSVKDEFKMLKNGTYTITIKNSDYEEVDSIKDISVLDGKSYTFKGLNSNSLYHIELSYETYRNNVGYTESEKINATPFTTFTYTPVDNNITLGAITARQVNSKSIVLAYNGASNLCEKITRVSYTISVNGSTSKVSGTLTIGENDVSSIFTVSSDKIPRFTIDVTNDKISNNTSFTFKDGNTYIISTVYSYYDASLGKYVELKDKDGKSNYTTMLNL